MIPPQNRLLILESAGKMGAVLEQLPLADAAEPLPISRAEMEARGWDEVDVVFVLSLIHI